MTTIFSKTIISILAFSIALVAYSCHTASNPNIDKIYADNSSTAIHHTNTYITDNANKQKNELTKIYRQSIAEYIRAVKSEYKISFDTLFFNKRAYGQPDDFPDIELPEAIEGTQIRLLTPEVGEKKQKERKSMF